MAESADWAIVIRGTIHGENFERIGANGVAVPDELFKLALASHGGKFEAVTYLVPNEANPQSGIGSCETSTRMSSAVLVNSVAWHRRPTREAVEEAT